MALSSKKRNGGAGGSKIMIININIIHYNDKHCISKEISAHRIIYIITQYIVFLKGSLKK